MTKFKSQGFNNTFKNARKGFNLAVRSEVNIRVHVTVAAIVLLAGFMLEFTGVEYCILLIAIAMVICTEMLNTAIEFALDSIYHNRYSKMVGMAKDISAGAVMFATVVSISIGVILFGGKIIAQLDLLNYL